MSAAAARIAQARRKQRVASAASDREEDVLQRSQRVSTQAKEVLASARKAHLPKSAATPLPKATTPVKTPVATVPKEAPKQSPLRRVDDRRDAACLECHTHVHIRHDGGYLTAANDESTVVLGDALEATSFKLLKPTSSTEPLRYGDVVQLVAGDSLYLGARAQATTDNEYRYASTMMPEPTRWRVLEPATTVPLGEPDENSAQASMVRSGDAVLLQHLPTQGILTCQNNVLQLVTDSFARSGANVYQPHLLPVQSATDVFRLYQARFSPPLPLWWRPRAEENLYVYSSKKKPPQQRRLFYDHIGVLQAQRQQQLQSIDGQERLLRYELVGALMGLPGEHIVLSHDRFTLQDPHNAPWDPTLRRLVTDLLPLASNYWRASQHCATRLPGYEYGRVHQAFCEALEALLCDYQHYVAQLSVDGSLRRLAVDLQASLHLFGVVERVLTTIYDKKGGSLLNAIRHLKIWTYEGDMAAATALNLLLERASVPYWDMLAQWLDEGVLEDPYEEFMVRCNPRKAWEHKFELVEEHVLEGFFSTPVTVGRALSAGKYWHAVRHVGPALTVVTPPVDINPARPPPAPTRLHYNMSAGVVSSFVQTMYYKASQALQRLLVNEFDLMGSLRLVKRYYLLDQGDFFVNFLDAAEQELVKDLSTVSRGRIQHWLESSVQLTESNGDGDLLLSSSDRKDNRRLTASALRCSFVTQSLADHLDKLHAATGGIDTFEPNTPQRHAYGGMNNDGITGLDAFVVDFASIPFPISLILSRSTIASYQLLFRHLFFAKYVERRLVHIWQDHQALKELQGLRGSFGPTFLLRQRMVHFMQQLIIYMLFEVIEPKWIEMEQDLSEATSSFEGTTDDILDIHNVFLQKVLEACLLTNREVVRALTKLMATCLMFSDQMRRFMEATKVEEEQKQIAVDKQNAVKQNLFRPKSSSHKALRKTLQDARKERLERVQRNTLRVERELSSESYQRMIARFDEVFSNNLRDFMVQLMRSDDLLHHHKVNLIACIDYNGFVSQSLRLQ